MTPRIPSQSERGIHAASPNPLFAGHEPAAEAPHCAFPGVRPSPGAATTKPPNVSIFLKRASKQEGPSGRFFGLGNTPPGPLPHFAAFTLIELLVVLAIIGLLAAIGIPMMKGFGQTNAMAAANRQLLDDIAGARSRAIAGHTTVYMVFVPPEIVNPPPTWNIFFTPTNKVVVGTELSNLYGGQFTTYALLSLRSVGDQPGRPNARYLTEWRTLPNGIFIATNKFGAYTSTAPDTVRNFVRDPTTFPFPVATNGTTASYVPYVGFDYLGRLISQKDEYIPLDRGSIFYARDVNGAFINQPADVLENPPGNSIVNSNVIHIDWLTGRARVERPDF
jgi:prepilin-type N-terminal cleavage/methylation domain-containing protein